MENKVKVGILLNSFLVPKWVFDMFEELVDDNTVHISAFIIRKNLPKKTKASGLLKMAPLIILSRIDKSIFKVKDNAFVLKDIRKLVTDVPIIEVETISSKYHDEFTKEAIQRIKKYDLDVLYRIGFRILKGDILTQCSKYGIWSFHHGDNKLNRGMPACFWEVYHAQNVTGATLQILTKELDGGKILGKVFISTIKHSYHLTKQALYRQAQSLFTQRIRFLKKYGFVELQKCFVTPNDRDINFYSYPLYKAPGFWKSLDALVKIIFRWINIKLHILFRRKKRWVLAWRNRFSTDLALYRFKLLVPPRGKFWADPFVIDFKEETFLFFEEVEGNNKGQISMMKYENKTFSMPEVVLKETFHLSYPFVFVHANNLFMIPETKEDKSIRLYKWNGKGFDFEKHLLKNIAASDPTLFLFEQCWWMFCAVQPHPDAPTNELHIFYSKRFDGPFYPHKLNPVSIDCRISRPAGNLFIKNNKLFRPSQDCSVSYGYATNIMEVTTINAEQYIEKLVDKITPSWTNSLKGVHTFNTNKKITVIDVNGKY